MRTKRKQARCPDVSAAVPPARGGRSMIDDWASGEDMPEGLGGVDPDYDRAGEVTAQMLRGSWRTPRFEGE